MPASVLPRAMLATGQLNMRAEWSQSSEGFSPWAHAARPRPQSMVIAANHGNALNISGLGRSVVLLLAVGCLFIRPRRCERASAFVIIALINFRLSAQAVQRLNRACMLCISSLCTMTPADSAKGGSRARAMPETVRLGAARNAGWRILVPCLLPWHQLPGAALLMISAPMRPWRA